MKCKVFPFVVLLLYVSSALAEEALSQNKNRKVTQHRIKATELDLNPRNDVENGGGLFPGDVGDGGPSYLCKWGCCGFGYRGYCSECCGSPEEAKAFMKSTQPSTN